MRLYSIEIKVFEPDHDDRSLTRSTVVYGINPAHVLDMFERCTEAFNAVVRDHVE